MSGLPFIQAPARLCLLRLSAIGDVCHALPVVRRIQDRWPDTRITWIIGKTEYGLVAGIREIDFLVMDKSDMRASLTKLKGAMQGTHYDALLHMQVALRASRLARHVPATIRLGFDRARAKDFQWLFTTHRIAARPRQHVMDGLLGFAEALGVPESPLRWGIPIPDTARQAVTERLKGEQRYLVMVPCSSQRSRNFRDWPPDRYREVAEHAAKKHDLQVVLAGGPSAREHAAAAEIAAGSSAPIIDLVGKTSLLEMLALLDGAAGLIAPDTGPIHMAGTVSTPVIGLYASSNPARTGPIDPRYTINHYPEALRDDCGKSVDEAAWGQRVRDPGVMLRIGSAEVCEMLDRLMSDQQHSGRNCQT